MLYFCVFYVLCACFVCRVGVFLAVVAVYFACGFAFRCPLAVVVFICGLLLCGVVL